MSLFTKITTESQIRDTVFGFGHQRLIHPVPNIESAQGRVFLHNIDNLDEIAHGVPHGMSPFRAYIWFLDVGFADFTPRLKLIVTRGTACCMPATNDIEW